MRYGDYDNVTKDVKTLNEILNRQGTNLLIDVIAEYAGEAALKFDLDSEERKRIVDSLVNELKESILERI